MNESKNENEKKNKFKKIAWEDEEDEVKGLHFFEWHRVWGSHSIPTRWRICTPCSLTWFPVVSCSDGWDVTVGKSGSRSCCMKEEEREKEKVKCCQEKKKGRKEERKKGKRERMGVEREIEHKSARNDNDEKKGQIVGKKKECAIQLHLHYYI